jgi:Cu(I)/Ag(I) efflux system membrane protein CusA/SilA
MAWFDYNFSVAVGVGFIALAGVAVETEVIMLVYLNQARQRMIEDLAKGGNRLSPEALKAAICEGATKRVRPVMMTSASIILGLLPVMLGSGTGSEIMGRIATPMVGGMVSALALTLLVLPVAYYLLHSRR